MFLGIVLLAYLSVVWPMANLPACLSVSLSVCFLVIGSLAIHSFFCLGFPPFLLLVFDGPCPQEQLLLVLLPCVVLLLGTLQLFVCLSVAVVVVSYL